MTHVTPRSKSGARVAVLVRWLRFDEATYDIGALERWLRRTGVIPATLLETARAFPKAEPSLLAALRVFLCST